MAQGLVMTAGGRVRGGRKTRQVDRSHGGRDGARPRAALGGWSKHATQGKGGRRFTTSLSATSPYPQSAVEVDVALMRELKENGFRSTRRTKLICTIGPATSGYEELEKLASNGMNVARLNMCHGSRQWHKQVFQRIRKLNRELGYSVAIMVDTEGSEVHIGDTKEPAEVQEGDEWTFTVRNLQTLGNSSVNEGDGNGSSSEQHKPTLPPYMAEVSYEAFAEDIKVKDDIISDGGMVRFQVKSVEGPDVKCVCAEPGILLPRANLTFRRHGKLLRARNAMLPTISAKDWVDIDFAIENDADLIAVSFVKTADTIRQLKSYLQSKCIPLGSDIVVPTELGTKGSGGSDADTSEYMPHVTPGVISKIESFDSIRNLNDIVAVSDGVMVARGDLGAQVRLATHAYSSSLAPYLSLPNAIH